MDRIRVYIYTAVSGYAWQGCDDDLAEALQKCVGQTMKDEAGGMRRWEIGGLNGTAIYRCHVRKGGDFQGRDSKYVALAFIPFACVGERRVDFAALWDHPYLAEPLGRGESLENLEIDLSAEGLVGRSAEGDAPDGPFWIEPQTVKEGMSGDEGDVLARLSELFQSRKTELGSLSARIERLDRGEVATQPKYTPFQSVVDEARARREFESAVAGNASEGKKTEAFLAWGDAVETLVKNADPETGRFRHFLGFAAFAAAERDAFEGSRNGDASAGESSAELMRAERLLDILGRKLDGDDSDLLDWVWVAVDEQRQRLLRAAGPVDGEIAICRALERRIEGIRGESAEVASWLKATISGNAGAAAYGDPAKRPPRLSPALAKLADRLDEERAGAQELASENADGKRKIRELVDKIAQLEKAKTRTSRAKPVAPAAVQGDGYRHEGQRKTPGGIFGDAEPPRRGAIWSIAKETLLWLGMFITISILVGATFCWIKGVNPLRLLPWDGKCSGDKPPVVAADGDWQSISSLLEKVKIAIEYNNFAEAEDLLSQAKAKLAWQPDNFAELRQLADTCSESIGKGKKQRIEELRKELKAAAPNGWKAQAESLRKADVDEWPGLDDATLNRHRNALSAGLDGEKASAAFREIRELATADEWGEFDEEAKSCEEVLAAVKKIDDELGRRKRNDRNGETTAENPEGAEDAEPERGGDAAAMSGALTNAVASEATSPGLESTPTSAAETNAVAEKATAPELESTPMSGAETNAVAAKATAPGLESTPTSGAETNAVTAKATAPGLGSTRSTDAPKSDPSAEEAQKSATPEDAPKSDPPAEEAQKSATPEDAPKSDPPAEDAQQESATPKGESAPEKAANAEPGDGVGAVATAEGTTNAVPADARGAAPAAAPPNGEKGKAKSQPRIINIFGSPE